MNTIIVGSSPEQFSPEYTAYKDRVVAAGGSIYSASLTNNLFQLMASMPTLVQVLDTRAGVAASSNNRVWFSLTGAATDATATIYGGATYGVDVKFNAPVWAGGAFNGGYTPRLELMDDYSWAMCYSLATGTEGFLWGERINNLPGGQTSSWTLMHSQYWQSYYQGANEAAFPTLARDTVKWLFVIKEGPVVTAYDEAGTSVFQLTLSYPIDEISLGIGGGTDSTGVMGSGFKMRSFLRANSAFTASERAAIQAI